MSGTWHRFVSCCFQTAIIEVQRTCNIVFFFHVVLRLHLMCKEPDTVLNFFFAGSTRGAKNTTLLFWGSIRGSRNTTPVQCYVSFCFRLYWRCKEPGTVAVFVVGRLHWRCKEPDTIVVFVVVRLHWRCKEPDTVVIGCGQQLRNGSHLDNKTTYETFF